ncbi:hypothetical protein [Bacillus sp. AK031]
MGLPKCGECGKPLSWWRVFKDLSVGSMYSKRKIECSKCGTKNMRIIWQHLAANITFIVLIATAGTFIELEISQSIILLVSILIGGMLLLPFVISYEPSYLPEEKDSYQ